MVEKDGAEYWLCGLCPKADAREPKMTRYSRNKTSHHLRVGYFMDENVIVS
jgi:hypothetical protein